MKILSQNFFQNIKLLGEMFINWKKYLLGRNVYKTEFCRWLLFSILQCTNISSLIYKQGTFSTFSSFVKLLLELPSNFMVLGVNSLRLRARLKSPRS